MPAARAASKSTIHCSWSGTNRSPLSGWMAEVGSATGSALGSGPTYSGSVTRPPIAWSDRLPAGVADDDEPLGELAQLRRL